MHEATTLLLVTLPNIHQFKKNHSRNKPFFLQRILDISLARLCQKSDIRRITNQPPLSPIIKSRRLNFFGHLARTDKNADASQIIFEPPPENWRRPPGRPRTIRMRNIHDDLSSLDLGICEARDLAQNWPLWRLMSLHSATNS